MISPPPGTPAHAPPDGLEPGMALLLQAREFAEQIRCGKWEFAVELASLVQSGVTPSALRWLVHNGYLEHGVEVTPPGAASRTFSPINNLTLPPGCCFILTESGHALARGLNRPPRPEERPGGDTGSRVINALPPQATHPRWLGDRQQLWCGPLLVKEFRRPAPHQNLVLTAFEEEGWPERIDDPLPGERDVDPKRRLHDTIVRLNRNQNNRLIVFRGDGSGRAIRWAHITQAGPAAPE